MLNIGSRSRSRDRSLDRTTRNSLMSGALRHGLRFSCEHGRTGECWECKFAGDFEEDRGRSMIRHSGNRWDAQSPSPTRDRALGLSYRYSRWDHPGACGNSSYWRRGGRIRSRSRSRSLGYGSWRKRSRSRSRSRSWSASPYRRSTHISNNVNINLNHGGGIWHRKERPKCNGHHRRRSRSRSGSRERGWRGEWRGDNRGIIVQNFRRRYSHDRSY